MWEQFVENAPQILQAISISVTAGFAIVGLNAWRRQLIGRRKFEAAEQILLASYKLQHALPGVRNPIVFSEEGTSRPRPDLRKPQNRSESP
jgi:hypothetical protein